MSALARFFQGDDELGKKDDDHRPPASGPSHPSVWTWSPTNGPRSRRRRIVVLCAVALLLYLFLRSVPEGLPAAQDGRDGRFAGGSHHGAPFSPDAPSDSSPLLPTGPPPRPRDEEERKEHYYTGPVRFYKLAASLHSLAKTSGFRGANRNVLFAAGNLESASRLLPLACEMARWERNDVHFAFMGRDDVPVQDIQEMNGASSDCDVFWHGRWWGEPDPGRLC
jgi:hypothetical protein